MGDSHRGPNGPTGPQGPIGTTGATGDKGYAGYTHWVNSGSPAPAGPKGFKGNKGVKGYIGPKGIKGNAGGKGYPSSIFGPKGNKGPNGLAATQGPIGDAGASSGNTKGNRGPNGPQGYIGPKGFKGTAGPASDRRAKTNVELITDSLEKVSKIRGVEFLWKSDYKPKTLETPTDIGVIAQEIKEVLPELIIEGNDGFLRVNYPQITSLLVNAFNEQNSKLNMIKKDIDSML